MTNEEGLFDKVGGIPTQESILLISPPGPEKSILSLKMISDALNQGEDAIYITTDILPSEIEEKSKKYKTDISSHTGKNLWFVDCYSWTLKEKPNDRDDIIVQGPNALNNLSIGIEKALEKVKNNPKIIFQSISTLLMYNNPEIVYRFIQIMGSKMKERGATVIFHVESNMHDEKVLTTLKHLVDNTMEIKVENSKMLILSPTLGFKDWTEYTY